MASLFDFHEEPPSHLGIAAATPRISLGCLVGCLVQLIKESLHPSLAVDGKDAATVSRTDCDTPLLPSLRQLVKMWLVRCLKVRLHELLTVSRLLPRFGG